MKRLLTVGLLAICLGLVWGTDAQAFLFRHRGGGTTVIIQQGGGAAPAGTTILGVVPAQPQVFAVGDTGGDCGGQGGGQGFGYSAPTYVVPSYGGGLRLRGTRGGTLYLIAP